MKKIILILFITALSGCDMFYDFQYDWVIPEDINTRADINNLMLSPTYNYVPDATGDFWSFPDETYYRTNEGNDCEDMAFLYVYLYHECLGLYDVKAVGLSNKFRDVDHMIFKVNGEYYESTGYGRGMRISDFYLEYEWDILFEWDYDKMIEAINRRRRR